MVKLKKVVIPLIIFGLTVLIVAALIATKPKATAKDTKQKAWLVNAIPAEFQTIRPQITVYGRIETPRDANLKAAVEADVESVIVLEGETVDRGELLLQLDKTDVELVKQQRQADVDEIIASIANENVRYQRDLALLDNQKQLVNLADNAVQRAKKLEQNKLTSRATLDESLSAYQQQVLALKQLQNDIAEHPSRLAQLEAAKKRAEALLKQSEVNLGRTDIRAPFASRVATLNVAIGDRVRPGDSLIKVYDLNNLEVRAQIPGRYSQKIRKMLENGQQIIASTVIDGEPIKLELKRLSGEVRLDSGGVDGLFRLMNHSNTLPLGTFVELQLQLAEQQHVIKLPFSALYGLDRIYVIEDGHLKAMTIERVGEVITEDNIQQLLIRSDAIQAGDLIVTTQLPNAITGLAVETAL
ncbi:efflux RND transporter periplasmic adaptor subunit [Methylophaga sp.]|uniref:efflux RND transporter periplasmic adaptor subunit n=1 Tax=Methylophaga sp. TaxID=2024840 RepID=UPI003A94440E